MPRSLHSGSVIPRGLIVDHVEAGPGLTITAWPVAASARCLNCDHPSSRVHSHYTRTLSDLPIAGRHVVIAVRVRRFRCVGTDYRTRIFAERSGPDLAAAYARRTARLDCIVHHLGLVLGGRPAATFARRLTGTHNVEDVVMGLKKHSSEKIVAKLPQVDVLVLQGRKVADLSLDHHCMSPFQSRNMTTPVT